MSDIEFPRFEVVFGGNDAYREALVVDAEEFIGVKSLKARGKRLTTFDVESINELEPLHFASVETENSNDSGNDDNSNENDSEEAVSSEGNSEEQSESVNTDKPEKNTKEKATAEVNENDSVLPDEIVDQNRIIDDINGQLTLF